MTTYTCLQSFIRLLEEKKLLIRVKEPVNTALEITEIHRRTLIAGGPALLFENVITEYGTSSIPVLTNLFGTVERIALALNTTPALLRDIGHKLAFFRHPEPPGSFREAVDMLPVLKDALAMKPKVVGKKASCQEIVWRGEDVDLTKLPIQRCWPDEPAPLITWPLVVTTAGDISSNNYNIGIYRMQVIAKNKTLMRWLRHRGGAEHHRRWQQKKNGNMPVAVIIGCDPATMLAAVTPVPDTLSEYEFAGLLRKRKCELVQCIDVPIFVPASSEIVLEGYASLDEYGDEGPYGDHTGYYNSVEGFPVFTITAITMRRNPIYITTFTGRPPDEPSILGEALNEIFIPLLQQQFPEIIDFWLPAEACSYRISVVSIKKSYPGHAKRIMMGIWSFLRQFTYTKFIIIVDGDINVRSWQDVMWAVSTRMDFKRDVVLVENTPMDYLDFASCQAELGAKIGFDATNKIGQETEREWGRKLEMDSSIVELVTRNWSKYGIF